MTSKSRFQEIVKFFQRFAIFFRTYAVNEHVDVVYKSNDDFFFRINRIVSVNLH